MVKGTGNGAAQRVKDTWAKAPRKATWTIYAAAFITVAGVFGAFEKVFPWVPVVQWQHTALAGELAAAQKQATREMLSVVERSVSTVTERLISNEITAYKRDLKDDRFRLSVMKIRLAQEGPLGANSLTRNGLSLLVESISNTEEAISDGVTSECLAEKDLAVLQGRSSARC